MITISQIEQGCEFIRSLISEAFYKIDYEIQDAGDSIIYFVELLRPLTDQEEAICEKRMNELSKIIPTNQKRYSPMVSCACRQGHGNCSYSFIGF